MSPTDPQVCGICDRLAAPTPRLTVLQDRHFDCPVRHSVGLCAEHGAELQAGSLPLHQLLFDWTHRHHADLYDGTRLILSPELACLGCNATLAAGAGDASVRCEACGVENEMGSALGSPAVVRLK